MQTLAFILKCQLLSLLVFALVATCSPALDPANDSPVAKPASATADASSITITTTTATPLDTEASTVTSQAKLIAQPSKQDDQQQQQQQQSSNKNSTILEADRSPKSDKRQVLGMFRKFFIKARSHDDQKQKEFVREGVVLRLKDLGFETSFLQKSRFEFRRRPAYSYNMISILPGRHFRTEQDQIVLVGAHWDSATTAPGVDDNGSGSACLLEIARLISENRCQFEHTVMLVWFDYEEQGKYGSEFFVNDYLYPYELDKYNSKFIGAFVLDMILVRDKENNTQTVPLNLKTKLTEFSDELEREKSRGDFLATWARETWDRPLEDSFRASWEDLGYESRTFKAMRPELPHNRLPNSDERFEWKDFFRSDHASFWFPPLTSNAVRRAQNRTTSPHPSLNAILLTDLGPWRKSYQKCYHQSCDDEHLLTDGNLAFMQQVIDSLVLTLLRVGHGECSNLDLQQQATNTSSTSITPQLTNTMTSTATTTTTTTTTKPDVVVLPTNRESSSNSNATSPTVSR